MAPRVYVLVLTLMIALAACTSSGDPAQQDEPDIGTGPEVVVGAEESPSPEPERDRFLPKEGDFVAVPIERYTPMWRHPGKGSQPAFAFDTHNPHGEKGPMLIEGATRHDDVAWYEVLLPIRPNGSTAWVRATDVRVRERTERIEVDLSKRTLEHYEGGDLVERFRIGVGTDQYPTGTGRFYVWVKVPYENPNNPYGIMALGLSGFSPVLSDWPGQGRMAVHGTPYASNRGQAVSHGCVRVYNPDMESLVDLPLGTPVIITA